MKVLVIEDEDDLRELIVFAIQSHYNGTVIEASSYKQAIEMLKAHKDINGVLCDYNLGDGNGGQIFQFMYAQKMNIPFILCSARSPNECPELKGQKIAGYIEKPNVLPGIEKLLGEVFKEQNSSPNGESLEYCPVKIRFISKATPAYTDFYIRLSEDKFVKIVNKGDSLSNDTFDRYMSKNLDNFYVKCDDAANFLASFSKDLTYAITIRELEPAENYQLSINTLATISAVINELGMTPEIQDLTKKSVNLALKAASKNPALKEIMANFKHDTDDYVASHSIIIGHISCALATLMNWNSETTFHKLILASFFHDITLSSQKIKRIKELDENTISLEDNLTIEERSYFKTHPLQSAALVQEVADVPPDVDRIIAQHHERPDGSGYPNKLNHTQIMPLAAVFILAQELYLFSTRNHNVLNLVEFVASLGPAFQYGEFKRILAKLSEHESLTK